MQTGEPKKSRKIIKAVFSYRFIASLVILFLVYHVYVLSSLVSPVKQKSEGLINELSGFREQNMTFASDLNEIRQYLLLPTKDYSSGNMTEPDSEDLKVALLTFIGSVGQNSYKKDKVNELQNVVDALEKSENFKTFLSAQNVTLANLKPSYDGENVYAFLTLKEGADELLVVRGNIVDGTFFAETPFEQFQLGKDIEANLQKYIEDNKNQWADKLLSFTRKKEFLDQISQSKEFKDLLALKKLNLSKGEPFYELSGDFGFHYKFGINRAELKFYTSDTSNAEKTYEDEASFRDALFAELSGLKIEDPLLKLLDEKKKMLEETFKDQAFQAFLDEFGGSVAAEPKDEPDRYVYELRREEEVIGSIILEKGTGLVKILKPGEEFATDIFNFSPESSKKKI